MRGKKRSTVERTRALGIAVVDGAAAASEQTGIPENTIRTWMESPEFVELRERTKEAVTGEWWGIVQQAFRRTSQLLEKTDDPVKAATAGAIVFDKMALSRGEATGRTEMRTWTDALDPDKQRRLRDWAFDRLDELDRRIGDAGPDAEGVGVRESSTGDLL